MAKLKLKSKLLCILSILCFAITVCFFSTRAEIKVNALQDLIDDKTGVTLRDSDNDGYYEIGTAQELIAFSNVNSRTFNAKLVADIVFESGTQFTPIADVNNDYKTNGYVGIFDGQGHTITGLTNTDVDNTYSGFIGKIGRGGVVKNLGLINAKFIGNSYVGLITGLNDGEIYNCYAQGVAETKASSYCGGIAGLNRNLIEECYTNGTFKSTDMYCGGITGDNSPLDSMVTPLILNCYSQGKVMAYEYASGIASTNFGVIKNCYSTATVEVESYYVNPCGITSVNSWVLENCYSISKYPAFEGMPERIGVVEVKSEEQFTSGEVACLLGQMDSVWGQTLNTANADKYPVLDGKKVYYSEITQTYSNYQSATQDENGVIQISTGEQLVWFSEQYNLGNLGASVNAVLTQDIDLKDYNWTPIGNSTKKFVGNFNGQGYKINNFNMTVSGGGYWGLFGFIDGASTQGKTVVENFSISGKVKTALTSNVDIRYGVVGQAGNKAEIRNINSTVEFTSNDNYQKKHVAGILGQAGDVKIENCSFGGKIVLGSSVFDCVGGILAYGYNGNSVYINNCSFSGEIYSSYSEIANLGGIVGYYNGENAKALSVSNCLSVGSLPAVSSAIIGALKNYGSTSAGVNNYCKESLTNDVSNVNATSVSVEKLKSGEIAYALNGNSTDGVWGQDFSNDSYPKLGGMKFYYSYADCSATQMTYNNKNSTSELPEHDYQDNGICVNGCFETATQISQENYQTLGVSEDHVGYYAIENVGNLYWFAWQVNVNNQVKSKAVLLQSLDLNGATWYPIGLYRDKAGINSEKTTKAFNGVFDGNGYTISNFVTAGGNYQGLFGYCSVTAIIKNVGVLDAMVSGWHAGTIVAYGGIVENCYAVNCTVKTTLSDDYNGTVYGGALTGYYIEKISNSFAYNCTVSSVAVNFGTICYNFPLGGDSASSVYNSYYGEIYTVADASTPSPMGTRKYKPAFESGEVAYLLGEAFGQSIGSELYPTLNGKAVYYGYLSCADDAVAVYTNDSSASKSKPSHEDFDFNHICDNNCGKTDIGDHSDSQTDLDHLCDYGCKQILEECFDGESDKDHMCDICGKDGLSNHEYSDATCDTAKTCSVCGATDGEALGHSWNNATCDKAKTCSVCGATDGEALGHSWNNATCDTAKTCSVCGATDGEALGHSWNNATCDTAKTCSVCGTTDGEALGHSYSDWHTVKNPTEDSEGKRQRVCNECGHTITESIEKLNKKQSDCNASLSIGGAGLLVLMLVGVFFLKNRK